MEFKGTPIAFDKIKDTSSIRVVVYANSVLAHSPLSSLLSDVNLKIESLDKRLKALEDKK